MDRGTIDPRLREPRGPARLYRAWQDGDERALVYWNSFLLAARESAELLAEDQYLGDALARLLMDLGIEDAGAWRIAKRPSFATLFALGAERWDIELPEAADASQRKRYSKEKPGHRSTKHQGGTQEDADFKPGEYRHPGVRARPTALK